MASLPLRMFPTTIYPEFSFLLVRVFVMKLIGAAFTVIVLGAALVMIFIQGSTDIVVVEQGPVNSEYASISATTASTIKRDATLPAESTSSIGKDGANKGDVQTEPNRKLEPVAIFSLAKSVKQINDAHYLIKRLGLGREMATMIDSVYPKIVAGLDNQRPAGGFAFYADDGEKELTGMAFLPVSNMKKLLKTLEEYGEVSGNKTFRFQTPFGMNLFLREIGDYVYVVNDKSLFDWAPIDPTSFLADRPENYNLGIEVDFDRVPESIKSMIVQQAKSAGQNRAATKPVTDQISQCKRLFVGINVDEFRDELLFDLQTVGNVGSEMAEQSSVCSKMTPTRFSGFSGDEIPFFFNVRAGIIEKDKRKLKDWLAQGKKALHSVSLFEKNDAASRAIALEMGNQLETLALTSIENGDLDCGFKICIANSGKLEMSGGLQVADSTEFESFIKQSIQAINISGKPDLTGELNVETKDGLAFHQVILKSPSEQPENSFSRAFGKEVKVLLGFGEDTIYFAVGENAQETLLAAIEQSKKNLEDGMVDSQTAIRVSGSLVPFINLIEPKNRAARKLKSIFSKSSNSDQCDVMVKQVPGGFDYQIRVQTGVVANVAKVGKANLGNPFEEPRRSAKSRSKRKGSDKVATRPRKRKTENYAPVYRPRLLGDESQKGSQIPFSQMRAIED